MRVKQVQSYRKRDRLPLSVDVTADTVLRRWNPTGWPASPFLELEPDSKPDSQVQNKSFKEAASKTKSITTFFKPVS